MANEKSRSGQLRHRVAIKRPPTGTGTRGQVKGDDQTVSPLEFCSIETISGREVEQSRAMYPEATYKVEMRIRQGVPIETGDYLLLGTRKLNIGHIDDIDQRGIKHLMLCAELK